MSVPAWIAVGLLGGVAAAARFAIDAEIVARADSEFPLGIFVVNVSGALALGVVAGLALDGAALTILAGGGIGSYTTFSTWILDSHRLDVAVTGALLHDIGKTEAYNDDPLAIDLTDFGRLQGEIPLGYYLVRRRIEDIPGFDPHLAQCVLHIILSHHGSLEHGSPVVPATREAVLVHMIDNLGGRLGSFDRIERELPAGQSWSGFDRALSGSAYFAARVA